MTARSKQLTSQLTINNNFSNNSFALHQQPRLPTNQSAALSDS